MDEKSVLREFILIDGMDSRPISPLINFRSHFNVNEVNESRQQKDKFVIDNFHLLKYLSDARIPKQSLNALIHKRQSIEKCSNVCPSGTLLLGFKCITNKGKHYEVKTKQRYSTYYFNDRSFFSIRSSTFITDKH